MCVFFAGLGGGGERGGGWWEGRGVVVGEGGDKERYHPWSYSNIAQYCIHTHAGKLYILICSTYRNHLVNDLNEEICLNTTVTSRNCSIVSIFFKYSIPVASRTGIYTVNIN